MVVLQDLLYGLSDFLEVVVAHGRGSPQIVVQGVCQVVRVWLVRVVMVARFVALNGISPLWRLVISSNTTLWILFF